MSPQSPLLLFPESSFRCFLLFSAIGAVLPSPRRWFSLCRTARGIVFKVAVFIRGPRSSSGSDSGSLKRVLASAGRSISHWPPKGEAPGREACWFDRDGVLPSVPLALPGEVGTVRETGALPGEVAAGLGPSKGEGSLTRKKTELLFSVSEEPPRLGGSDLQNCSQVLPVSLR